MIFLVPTEVEREIKIYSKLILAHSIKPAIFLQMLNEKKLAIFKLLDWDKSKK